jgi:hypothetical protein
MLVLIAFAAVKDRFECLGSFDRNIYNTGMIKQALSGPAATVSKPIIVDAQNSLVSYQNFCSSGGGGSGGRGASGTDTPVDAVSTACYPTSRLCGSFCDASPYPAICRNPSSMAQAATPPPSDCQPNNNTGINYAFPAVSSCTTSPPPPPLTSFPYVDTDATPSPSPPSFARFPDPPFSRFDSMTAVIGEGFAS